MFLSRKIQVRHAETIRHPSLWATQTATTSLCEKESTCSLLGWIWPPFGRLMTSTWSPQSRRCARLWRPQLPNARCSFCKHKIKKRIHDKKDQSLNYDVRAAFLQCIPSGKLENLYLGSDSSDCPLPCATFSTEAKVSSEVDEYLGFLLNFVSTVQVTFLNLSPLHPDRTHDIHFCQIILTFVEKIPKSFHPYRTCDKVFHSAHPTDGPSV